MNTRENVTHGLWSTASNTAVEMERLGIIERFIAWAMENTDPSLVTDIGIGTRAHGFLAGWLTRDEGECCCWVNADLSSPW